jgi:hypothetical protein
MNIRFVVAICDLGLPGFVDTPTVRSPLYIYGGLTVVVDAWAHVCSKVVQRSTVWVCAPLMVASVVLTAPAAALAAPTVVTPMRLPAAVNAPDEESAMKLAAQSGTRVEVLAERTEYEQFFAEPDGRLTYETAVLPQRVRRSGGTWADVDLSLQPPVDGTVRPKASVADVRFSADGRGPVVTLVDGKKTFTMSWPGGKLRAPKVVGTTATYAEVMPGVDLVVRPTELGFSHVLTVKSAVAATNPELRNITFELGGDAKVSRLKDGSLQAVAGRSLMASAPAPGMWDSRTAVTTAKASASAATALEGAAGDPSTAAAPGDTARTASVETEVTASGDLVLKPDEAMLAGAATFPLFIDPDWSTGKKRWAYSTHNNTNNGDVSRARVGNDPDGRIYRSYFEFSTAAIRNKHVESAKVRMELDHSYSCTDTWTSMFSANPITATPRMGWKSSKPFLKHLAAQESHANEGAGCSDSPQPDMTVNFASSSVTSWLNGVASKGSTTATVAFSAGNATLGYENTKDRWKKFFPNQAKLIADVDAKPGKPYSLQVNKVACKTGSTAIGIGITNPFFGAVIPDADSGQALKSTWEWQNVSGIPVQPMPSPAITSTIAGDRDISTRVTGAKTDTTYRFRVKSTDQAPYLQPSEYSDWCYFRVDTTDPPVFAEELSKPEGPGKPGTYRITSTALDVVKFRYGWNAASKDAPATSWTDANGVAMKAATVTLTALKYGESVLALQAVDTTGNEGDGSLPVTVPRPAPPVAHWDLETYPGQEPDAALMSQSASSGQIPLTGNGFSWDDGQRLVGGKTATFAGAGGLTTTVPVVDATLNYAVAAWVKLKPGQPTGHQTIVSQDGATTATFALQYRTDDRNGDSTADKSFCFAMLNQDGSAPTATSTVCAVNAAVADRWTHVAGGYDATDKKMRLWINGVSVPDVTAPAAWPGSGALRIGERKTTGGTGDRLFGSVADVQVFDRMLVDEDFTGKLAEPGSKMLDEPGILEPIEVGRWDFDAARSCYDPADPIGCDAPDGAAWKRQLRLTQGTDIGEGTSGRFVILDDQPLDGLQPGDPGYGTTTREYGVSQRNTAPEGEPVQWQDAPVLRTDQSFTVSARVYLDSTAKMTALAPKGAKQSAFYLGSRPSTSNANAQHFEVTVPSADQDVGETDLRITDPRPVILDEEGSWTQLTLVYDAGASTLQLFVNGEPIKDSAGQVAKPTKVAPLWNAAGPLVVGSSWATPDNAAGAWTDNWFGGIDDVRVYQGAMNATQVRKTVDVPADDGS